jgi:hypothetical protein
MTRQKQLTSPLNLHDELMRARRRQLIDYHYQIVINQLIHDGMIVETIVRLRQMEERYGLPD